MSTSHGLFPGALVCIGAALSGGCTSGADDDSSAAAGPALARSVLLVTLDTTRSDHLGAYGSKTASTPVLDGLAGSGLLYERAYSTTPITLPSHTSILTGLYPSAHGVRDNGLFSLGPAAISLPEVLAEAGMRTGAFVGSYVLDARFGLSQGFEVYGVPKRDRIGTAPEIVERRADAVVDEALGWLSGLDADDSFFAWVHFYDPHSGYDPPPEYRARFADPYDGEIAFCDAQLGRLLDGLREMDRADDLLVIVTADHGEAFGDHGEKTHGIFLYESTMRVPLIVSLPNGRGGRGRRLETVSIADIPATVLDALGLSPSLLPDAVSSPLPGLRAGSDVEADRAIYIESHLPYHSFRWHPLEGLVTAEHKLVRAPRPELYHLGRDRGELNNLVDAESGRYDELCRRLDRLLERYSDLGLAEARVVNEDERQRLEKLGYTVAGADGGAEGGELSDPKDRIGDLVLRARGQSLLRQGRALLGQDAALLGHAVTPSAQDRARGKRVLLEARDVCRKILDGNPRDPQTLSLLGLVEIARQDFEAAIAPLERAMVASSRSPQLHYNLAISYAETGAADSARRQMQQAVTVQPDFQLAIKWLGRFHDQRGEAARAAWWMKQLEEVLPAGAQRDGVARRRSQLEAPLDVEQLESAAPDDFPAAVLGPEGRD